jgi:hypothetical protein
MRPPLARPISQVSRRVRLSHGKRMTTKTKISSRASGRASFSGTAVLPRELEEGPESITRVLYPFAVREA